MIQLSDDSLVAYKLGFSTATDGILEIHRELGVVNLSITEDAPQMITIPSFKTQIVSNLILVGDSTFLTNTSSYNDYSNFKGFKRYGGATLVSLMRDGTKVSLTDSTSWSIVSENYDRGESVWNSNKTVWINPEEYFNSSNPTSKTAEVELLYFNTYAFTSGFNVFSAEVAFPAISTGTQSANDWLFNFKVGDDIHTYNTRLAQANLTFNIPPTINNPRYSSNTGLNNIVQNVTNLTIMGSATAACGGYIKELNVNLGDVTGTTPYGMVSRYGSEENPIRNFTINYVPQEAGTFPINIRVVDSRDIETIVSLGTVNVRTNYATGTINNIQRILSSSQASNWERTPYVLDDEGENAIISFTPSFPQTSTNNLLAPQVMNNDTTLSVTWYSEWSDATGFAGVISDWNSVLSGTTIYGKITNVLDTSQSHTIEVIPRTTSLSSGTTITAILSQSFYLLVGRKGGHALGIGMKPTNDNGLYVGMNIYLNEPGGQVIRQSDEAHLTAVQIIRH